MPFEDGQRPAVAVPQPGGAVVTGGDDARAVGAEGRRAQPTRMPLEDGQRPAVAVPQPGGAVVAGGDNARAVGAEGRRAQPTRMPFEDGQRPAVAVPQPGGVVVAGGDDARAVGAEGRRVHRLRMPFEDGQWPARVGQRRVQGAIGFAGQGIAFGQGSSRRAVGQQQPLVGIAFHDFQRSRRPFPYLGQAAAAFGLRPEVERSGGSQQGNGGHDQSHDTSSSQASAGPRLLFG